MKTPYIFISAAAICLAWSCGNNSASQATQTEQVPIVALATAVSEQVVDDQIYSSTVEPWAKNNIAPQTSGRIEVQYVDVGDFVTAGQEVAHMDNLQLAQSELQINNDKIELERLTKLYNKGGLSQSDYDTFVLTCELHKAQYANLLKNTILRSPLNGVVSERNYDAGDMYSMASPLFVVEQIVPVKLLVGVSESDYSRVKKGDEATITTDAFTDRAFKGRITNIYPTMDSRTHTFTAEVRVDNADRKLRPGMYAKVNVVFGTTERVLIPDVAVTKQQGSGDRFVYVYNADGTVSLKTVELGRRYYDRYVVLSGVEAGDRVVIDGILRLKDGIKVNIAEE